MDPGRSGCFPILPFMDLPPGLYVLRIEAAARVGDRNTASQEVVFRVLPAAQQ